MQGFNGNQHIKKEMSSHSSLIEKVCGLTKRVRKA